MNYTPLNWCEQEYLKYKAHFEVLPRAPCSLRLFALKVKSHKILPVGPTGRSVYELTKLITQRLQVHGVHLAAAYVDIKKCAATKEFCMIQSYCC